MEVNNCMESFQTVYPDIYRGNWGGSKCRDSLIQVIGRKCDCKDKECIASEKYFQKFDESFRFSLPCSHNIAAFIAESIQVFFSFLVLFTIN